MKGGKKKMCKKSQQGKLRRLTNGITQQGKGQQQASKHASKELYI